MQRLTFDDDGVRLSDLLVKAGAPLGEKLRGRGLATYVVAHPSDEYAVVSLEIARSPGPLRVFKTPK